MRQGSTARSGFRQNCAGTVKTPSGGSHFRVREAPPVRVFAKIAPEQEKPFWAKAAFVSGKHHPCGFLFKLRRNRKNLFGRKLLSRQGSTARLGFRQNCAGQEKPFRVEAAFALGSEKIFVFCSLSHWGSTTRSDFCPNYVGTAKTPSGGSHFRVRDAPPVRVFVKIAP